MLGSLWISALNFFVLMSSKILEPKSKNLDYLKIGTDDKQQDNDVEEKKSKEEQNISDSDASSDGLNKE